MNIVKILDEGIINNEEIIIKNEIKMECLAVNQKPNEDKTRASK